METEEGRNKCASFWTKPLLPAHLDGWTISLEKEELLASSKPDHRLVKREFTARHHNEVRRITQLHYENWPDSGVPNLHLFIRLLDAADAEHSGPSPIIVHCSAGIGRSGTFVAAHSLRKEIRKKLYSAQNSTKIFVNIPQTIYLLRKERPYLVGTPKQLQTVYLALAKEYQARKAPYLIL